MIILRIPKGWTAPKKINEHFIEGYWRAHQVPFSDAKENPESLKYLEEWLLSYEPNKLFEENGSLREDLKELSPKGDKRMSANPNSNCELLRKDLKLPDPVDFSVEIKERVETNFENTKPLGKFLKRGYEVKSRKF